MHNKVVFRAAAGLIDAGLSTLKFNFSGVGESTGTHNELVSGREDVRNVLDYITGLYPSEDLTLAGFSFGSRNATEVGHSDDRVKRLISIGTPVDKYGDYHFLIGTTKPILFIHGDRDEFGSIDTLRPLIDEIAKTADVELKVFENCGHFFDEHLSELRETVRKWTDEKLAAKYLAF